MVLDNLGGTLKKTLQKITQSIFVDDALLDSLVRDLQRALLASDVNVKQVFSLSQKIKERCKQEPSSGLSKKEQLITIVYDEISALLGREHTEIEIGTKKPHVLFLVGLYGAGKTTTAGKLAKYYQKRGLKVALMSTDTWRPAAYLQLEQLGKKLSLPVFGDKNAKDPVALYKQFLPSLSAFDFLIVDTAGRDALSVDLISELRNLAAIAKPDNAFLVMNAEIGQAAQKQAEAFREVTPISGVIITRMDGTAKGGGALSACATAGAPVRFLGVGEKVEDLESYDAKRFVSRLLGMGDISGLLEKAKEVVSEDAAQDLGKRLMSGKFNLIDLHEQMQMMASMGPLGKVMEMIPGFGSLALPKDALVVQEKKLEAWKHIMDSCTEEELSDPDVIDAQRIERIAAGSGTSTSSVRELLKQYQQAKKMVKMMRGGSMEKMLKKMGGKLPVG